MLSNLSNLRMCKVANVANKKKTMFWLWSLTQVLRPKGAKSSGEL